MTYRRPPQKPTTPRPLPPEIYRRRRFAAFGIVLVLLALLIWGLTAWARSGSSDQGSDTTTVVPDTVVTEPTVTVSEETTTASATTTGSTPSTTTSANAAAGKNSCALEDLKISARTSEPSYDAHKQPDFFMTVENPTAVDCVIDLTANQLRFEVYNMATNQRVWSDTDCHAAVLTGSETFAPGKPREFEAVWSRNDSQPGRCTNRQAVPAGSYYLHAVIGNRASDPADFALR
ncbi:hypothetical protein CAPI_08075 [Corynebacterium capitovis DSM 44611]|uniref:hypothetical protein n=1 Tax=Corynebacterium capitovis TaxID=131081 RepID=UPI000375820D|nr:hypothetical protein [Corynebacterium capitovis]WKD58142.1 hypothetical protein CAPI_08075 [Corynebacterium capitovis DSM 44611]